jgi:hypothetical protein
LFGFEWGSLIAGVVTFAAGAVVFLIRSSLKQHAYDLAERDGITPK